MHSLHIIGVSPERFVKVFCCGSAKAYDVCPSGQSRASHSVSDGLSFPWYVAERAIRSYTFDVSLRAPLFEDLCLGTRLSQQERRERYPKARTKTCRVRTSRASSLR